MLQSKGDIQDCTELKENRCKFLLGKNEKEGSEFCQGM